MPTFVVGTVPGNAFAMAYASPIIPTTAGNSQTLHLTSVTYYGDSDAGTGFDCEETALREVLDMNGTGSNLTLGVAMVESGFTTLTSGGAGKATFTSTGTYSYQPSCAGGVLTTDVTTGRWGSTATATAMTTTVTLEGFTSIGCVHNGKTYPGTEVDTFTLVAP